MSDYSLIPVRHNEVRVSVFTFAIFQFFSYVYGREEFSVPPLYKIKQCFAFLL